MPTPIPIDPDAELRYAVLLSQEFSRERDLSLYDAWFAARAVALMVRPDLDEMETGRRVALILAWNDRRYDAAASRHDKIEALCA